VIAETKELKIMEKGVRVREREYLNTLE